MLNLDAVWTEGLFLLRTNTKHETVVNKLSSLNDDNFEMHLNITDFQDQPFEQGKIEGKIGVQTSI